MEEIKSFHSPSRSLSQTVKGSSMSSWNVSKQSLVSPEVSSGIKLTGSLLPQDTSGVVSPLDTATDYPCGQSSQHDASPLESSVIASVSEVGQFASSNEDARLDKSTVSFDVSSVVLPPCSASVVGVSSQGFSSQQTIPESFVFGAPTSISKPFQFTPSSSLLCAVPFGATTATQPSQFNTSTTFSFSCQPPVGTTATPATLSNSIPLFGAEGTRHLIGLDQHPGSALSISGSGIAMGSLLTSSHSSIFGTLPPFNLKSSSFEATKSPPAHPTLPMFGTPVTSSNILGHLPITTTTVRGDFPAFGKVSSDIATTSKLQATDSSDMHTPQFGFPFSQEKSLSVQPLTTSSVQSSSSSQGGFTFNSTSEFSKLLSFGSVVPVSLQSLTSTNSSAAMNTTHALSQTQKLPTSLSQRASSSFIMSDTKDKHLSSFPTLSSSSIPLVPSSDSHSIPSLPLTQVDVTSKGHSILYGLDEPGTIGEAKNETIDDTKPHDRSGSPYFEPLVSLPLVEDIRSGEEDEETLFSHRAKLYRFVNNQWKERGVGDLKILKHKKTGKVRLLMRRDHVLKLCCNHYITSNMSLKEVKGSTQLAWFTSCDFSDGVSKPEKFMIKFKYQDTGETFKHTFDKCVLDMSDVISEEQSLSGSTTSDHRSDLSNLSVALVNSGDNTTLPHNFEEEGSPLVQGTQSVLSKNTVILRNSWTCDTCLIQNEATDAQCIACGSTNPEQKEIVPSPPSLMSKFPASGGWICVTCLVENRNSHSQCVACGSTKQVPKELPSQSKFTPPPDGWTCDSCLVQNKAVDIQCVACNTFKTCQKEASSLETKNASAINLSPGTWSCSSCSTQNFPSVDKCIKCRSPKLLISSPFKFGQEHPFTSGQFGGIKIDALKSFSLKESDTPSEPSKTETGGLPVTGFSLPAFQLPKFKPISFSDPSLSVSATHNQPIFEDDNSDSLECEPDVYFTPVVSLPEKIEKKTGEETEEIMFCDHAKLFRFDDQSCSWKERGIGDIKILRNKTTGKSRLLMRREQVLKICCNHNITAEMVMTPMPTASKTWIWYTSCDFADEEGKPEKFAIKFKDQGSADKFKEVFDQCVTGCDTSTRDHQSFSVNVLQQKIGQSVRIDLNYTSQITDQPATVLGNLDDCIVVKVEMPSQEKIELARKFLLPDSFFNYENKLPCPGCRGCSDQIVGRYLSSEDQTREGVSVAVEHSYSVKEGIEMLSSRDVFGSTFASGEPAMSFADLADSQLTSCPFSLGSSHRSTFLDFEGAGEALFSVQHAAEGSDPEAEADVQFKPLVSLSEVNIRTGEELEEILFTCRAKLFRFEESIKQWKERGIGDIKLLRNVSTNKTRILMRRDQVLKVCCNHFITADMELLAHQERSWMWYTLSDFADEIPRPEKFAVRFKCVETAQKFKVAFEDCVSRCTSSESLVKAEEQRTQDIKDVDLQERFAPRTDSWSCNSCFVHNPESVTMCLACLSPKPGIKEPKLLSPQTSTDILRELHICSPTEVVSDHTSQGFQLPLNITLPTYPTTSGSSAKTTTVTLSPRLTSPDMDFHVVTSPICLHEKEEVTFSAEGLLFYEDLCTKQWKEGGNGNMKIIKNKISRERRLLMISNDKKSVICAHGITSMMNLRPHAEKEYSWIWNGFDNRRSTPTESAIQKYCIEFHSKDNALMFKNAFGMSFSLPTQCKQRVVSTSNVDSSESGGGNDCGSEQSGDKVSIIYKNQTERAEEFSNGNSDSDDVIFVCEENPGPELIRKAEELLLPRSFYLYEKKPPCRGCRGCISDDETVHSPYDSKVFSKHQPVSEQTTTIKIESVSVDANSNDKRSEEKGGFSSAGMLSFADLISQTDASFSKKSSGFRFQGTGKQLFCAHAPDEGDDNPEAESDIDFQPIVSLPETYSVKSWDEDAVALFSHRAKLFRFDVSTKQWKERGIGDMKILQHLETKKIRLIMRRDQIFKLCCNHYLTNNMQLKPFQTENQWMWFTPSDFSGDNPQPEQFAIKFKHTEKGLEFKKIFDECVVQQEKLMTKQLPTQTSIITDIHLKEVFKTDIGSWECNVCLVRNKSDDSKCAACDALKPGTDTASNPYQEPASAINFRSTTGITTSFPSPASFQSADMDTSGSTTTTSTTIFEQRSSGGIKIPLLQDTPLTSSKSLIPSSQLLTESGSLEDHNSETDKGSNSTGEKESCENP